jgi:peptidoglycan L-alanyl-D-glutamate endopeptidase CwlK
MSSFSANSLLKLETCAPRLQSLFREVVKHRDCTILCGNRGKEEQELAFREGKSKAHYGESKHNYSPSCAVDVMPYPINWDDMNGLREFAGFVQGVAAHMNIQIQWGGNFKGFFDGPHYELLDTSHSRIPT